MIDHSCFTNGKEIQMAKLKELRATAETVAHEKEDLEAAGRELRLERAVLLENVILALKPALPALCSSVGAAATWSPAGTNVVPAAWRGLYLAGTGPERHDRSSHRGRYVGERLMLRQDGALVILVYDGPWSAVPGEVSSWRTEERVVTGAEAAEAYDIDVLIDALRRALEAQATGGSPRRAAQMRDKADRLRALQKLVGSWQ
jgi:hypothetical protein